MSAVCIRVSKELKEKMDRRREIVNWSEEIMGFIERRVEDLEQEKAINELKEFIRELTKVPLDEAVGM
ncbi:MAG: CopG family transcriptional regulator [Ignisphaera sp.]|nr:CopG family transcriptional regulator [Ignisphaera sp.]MCC6056917.1 CopG family transcriptional regulator [Desulfurococcaceae archaeon]